MRRRGNEENGQAMEGIECHARSSAGTGNSGMKEASECVIKLL